MRHIFGPVPSRRLGRSLGVDVIPYKTCSFDCVYCESGRTTHLTVKRQAFVMPEVVLQELADYFHKYPQGVDVITFSSAGEPTLYEPLGELVRGIKKQLPSLPLVMITNGSLLWDRQVRKDLMAVDRVIPSLDAATQQMLESVNAPHPSLDLSTIKEGLAAFRKEYHGEFYLEVLLASGYNDQPEHLRKLGQFIDRLKPDQVELNTVVRPPAKSNVRGLTEDQMKSVLQFFPEDRTHIVGQYDSCSQTTEDSDLAARVVKMVRRRPCTMAEMAASLGVESEGLATAVQDLEKRKLVVCRSFNDVEYICSSP